MENLRVCGRELCEACLQVWHKPEGSEIRRKWERRERRLAKGVRRQQAVRYHI